jgi:hypothetical protein
MPSALIDWVSGGFNLLSGVPGQLWSGWAHQAPVGGIQIVADPSNSGAVYVAFSGGMTIQSGGYWLSGQVGSGYLDGMPVQPGGSYFVPKLAFPLSGAPQLFVQPSLAASGGYGRLYWEIF